MKKQTILLHQQNWQNQADKKAQPDSGANTPFTPPSPTSSGKVSASFPITQAARKSLQSTPNRPKSFVGGSYGSSNSPPASGTQTPAGMKN